MSSPFFENLALVIAIIPQPAHTPTKDSKNVKTQKAKLKNIKNNANPMYITCKFVN